MDFSKCFEELQKVGAGLSQDQSLTAQREVLLYALANVVSHEEDFEVSVSDRCALFIAEAAHKKSTKAFEVATASGASLEQKSELLVGAAYYPVRGEVDLWWESGEHSASLEGIKVTEDEGKRIAETIPGCVWHKADAIVDRTVNETPPSLEASARKAVFSYGGSYAPRAIQLLTEVLGLKEGDIGCQAK